MDWAEWVTGLLSESGVWSLVTMAVSVGGLWLGGHEPRWSWWYGLPCQVVWATAGFVTQRPGDIVLSVIFSAMYIRNLRKNRGASYRDQRAALDETAQLRAEVVGLRDQLARRGESAGTR